jgi:hypothetical protein
MNNEQRTMNDYAKQTQSNPIPKAKIACSLRKPAHLAQISSQNPATAKVKAGKIKKLTISQADATLKSVKQFGSS